MALGEVHDLAQCGDHLRPTMPTMPTMPTIKIQSADATLVVQIREGETLFDAGAKVTARIDTACVGKGTCGLCRVKILAGAEHLNPFTDEERKHLGNVYHITKVRLACRTKPTGDVTIEVVRKKK